MPASISCCSVISANALAVTSPARRPYDPGRARLGQSTETSPCMPLGMPPGLVSLPVTDLDRETHKVQLHAMLLRFQQSICETELERTVDWLPSTRPPDQRPI